MSRYILKINPKAKPEVHHGLEASYLMPSETIKRFPDVFKGLERLKGTQSTIPIVDYGLTMTSLEEIFLKIGEEEQVEEELKDEDSVHLTPGAEDFYLDRYDLRPSWLKSYLNFLKFRSKLFFRDKNSLISVTVFPVMIFILSYFLMSNTVVEKSNEPLKLTSEIYSLYNEPILYYTSENGI